MRELFLLVTFVFSVLLAAPGSVSAEGQEPVYITVTEVEDILNSKLYSGEPLTQEALTKMVMEMKDEKISDLEGNISKIINSAAVFIGVVAILLALVTGFIGWYFKNSVDKTLTAISAKEENINKLHQSIVTKEENVEEYYREVKRFKDDLEKFDKRLFDISENVKKSNSEFQDLRKYVSTIEDVTNSIMLILQFFNKKEHAAQLVQEATEVLQHPQKFLEHTIYKLEKTLGVEGELSDVDDVVKHLDYLTSGLLEEECNLWSHISRFKGINKQYVFQEDDDVMTLFEEIESDYENWEGYLSEIEQIKQLWEAHLAMNPINKNTEEDSEDN